MLQAASSAVEEPRLGVRFAETQFRAILASTVPCRLLSVCPREPLLPSKDPSSEAAAAESLVLARRRGIVADASSHKREAVA